MSNIFLLFDFFYQAIVDEIYIDRCALCTSVVDAMHPIYQFRHEIYQHLGKMTATSASTQQSKLSNLH